MRRVDASAFPTGATIDYESPEEVAGLAVMRAQAWAYINRYRWAPPFTDLVLAFGVESILALFLAQRPIGDERWVVVGDLPSMQFKTDDLPTPPLALRAYCIIAEDWAENVLAGRDLSDSYPIPVTPTLELAEILLSRVDFIRRELVPRA